MKKNEIKPIVKWVGGKRQSLEELRKYVPEKYNTYIEPFIGGGALFFDLKPKKAIINDKNEELINLYKVIKNNKEDLISNLMFHENTKEYFYEIRALDREEEKFKKLTDVERASRMLYLNRTCFNGMYRVNKKNQFNVPYGKYKNPKILDKDNIEHISEYFNTNDINIMNDDFEKVIALASKKDFVYLDPPYYPISNTSNFTDYNKDGFSLDDQIRLKENCDILNERGVQFLESNSYSDIILELYKDYNIIEIYSKRVINSDSSNRGEIKEILITNMEV